VTGGPFLLLETLDGSVIVAILSGLLFVEECGLPLPMAPGDVILLVGGMAVATGRVNLVVVVVCVSGALILGAFTGREIFARIGAWPLWSIAGRLGATGLLDKAARRLRQGGWRCIFVCRLVPGLRVHTNWSGTNSLFGRYALRAVRWPRGRRADGPAPTRAVRRNCCGSQCGGARRSPTT